MKPHFNRRQFAAGLGASAVLAQSATGCVHRTALQTPPPPPAPSFRGPDSLKAHAASRGFLFGCAVDTDLLQRDEAYATLVREQSNIVVAENAMKWGLMRPTIDTYDFGPSDLLVAFAETNHIKVRGHNLCWHRQLPTWFDAAATSANARQFLTTHIQTVAGRYAGRMHSWDVVNEAVLISDGRPDGLRTSPWLKLIGEDYIELAFRTARDADPQALLTYNDYGIEAEDEPSARKRSAVLTLLRRLQARHVPLDAIGVQSHVSAGTTYGTGLRDFLSACRDMGLQILVTEMDVNDRNIAPDPAIRDEAVATTYTNYLDLVLHNPSVRVVITWGITDRRTWLNSEDARQDHLPERCLPFDNNDAATKAFFAIRTAFDQRQSTPLSTAL